MTQIRIISLSRRHLRMLNINHVKRGDMWRTGLRNYMLSKNIGNDNSIQLMLWIVSETTFY
mgnify:CR=1 FL=1